MPDFFHRREFTFTLENDVFVRYLCFKDAEEFSKAVMARLPERIEIGPVYTASPDKNKVLKKDVFKPTERELIFDIDMNDYDDIRTCCKGANVCKRCAPGCAARPPPAPPPQRSPRPPPHPHPARSCWAFVNVAVRVLDSVLREDFAFQHIMFVFSGRRGAHAWVSDEAARKLSDEQRAAVLGFVNVFSTDSSAPAGVEGVGGGGAGGGGGGGGGPGGDKHLVAFFRVMNGLTVPLHPALDRAYQKLEGMFERLVIPESGQRLLCAPEHWDKVLDMLPAVPGVDLRRVVGEAWASKSSDAAQRWAQLKSTIKALAVRLRDAPRDSQVPHALKRSIEKLLPAIVFAFTYPRLDVEVSKHRNHLLKAPFCIHPKTGKICVPFRLANLEEFDPNAVPTCRVLMDEGNKWLKERGAAGGGGGAPTEEDRAALIANSSLRPYIAEFETFLCVAGAALAGGQGTLAHPTPPHTPTHTPHTRTPPTRSKEIAATLQRGKRAAQAARERQAAVVGEW